MRPLPLHRALTLGCALATAAALGACAEIPEDHDAATTSLGPIAVGAHLIAADLVADELVTLAVDAGDVTAVRRVPLAGHPSALAALPDGASALVLSRSAERLDKVTLATGERATYALGAPFEALAVSPDGDAVLAYYPRGATSAVFHNENELAYVDLRDGVPPEDAVTNRTLASLGGAPLGVYASPPAFGRRFALVLSEEHVAVVDLHDPDARERSVPLVSLGTGGTKTPLGATFAVESTGGEEVLWALVTTAEGGSVFALRVADAPPSALGDPSFDVRLNQLAGFTAGGSVALATLPDGRLVSLMTSPSAGTVTVTELDHGTSESLTIESGLNRLYTYVDEGRPTAVMFRAGSVSFHILDVAALEERKEKSYRTRFAQRPIVDLLPIPDTPLFVAFHNDALEGVSVIDADTDRVNGFGKTGSVRGVLLAQDLGRLYLLTRVDSEDFVVAVTLADLHPEVVAVPGRADAMLLSRDGGTIATTADLPGGQLVLWPALLADDSEALAVPGYLLDSLLDR
ncbi:MAG: hypothetical protein KC635_13845 [Myxococcales bacterium]|nr:hypothetical protein [Myxococcales bacterium]MCB9734067.1 hypothetical protein [Deltaproteobacteria bacterium]